MSHDQDLKSPMELIAIGSGGVVSMLRRNQSIALGDLRYPLTIDNRQSVVYYSITSGLCTAKNTTINN